MISAPSTGWRRARLADCCEVVSGATPRTDRPEFWDGDVAWATPRDLSNLDGRVLTNTADRITIAGYKSCSATMLPPGAVLFSSRAPIGLVAIAGIPVCTNQGFKSFIPGPDVDTGYLFWCLRREAPRIANRGSGSTFAEVSKEVISRFEIPLPPLAEQRRIAAVMDKADGVRRKRRESLRLLDKLLRSAFLEMFGDPVRNEKGWRKLSFGELLPDRSAIVDGPFGSSLKPESYVESGVRVIRNFNISDDSFDGSAFKYVTEAKFEEVKRSEVKAGDVLISTKGTLGNVCLMPHLPGNSVLSASGTVRVRLPDESSLRRQFLVSQMVTGPFKGYLKGFEAGTNQKYLNLAGIRRFEVAIPPIELQDSFVRLRDRVEQHRARYSTALETSRNLFDSLAQRAFRGDL